ncbi:MAG: Sec-independent protein translocase subunit TatA, partial [Nevskia sp.]|nr:Sec-independent protein translocase subunit TatA [Nevskia sp.]
MFSGSISVWHWLIVLAIAVTIFGTRKLRTAGSDLGGALKEFR